MSESSLESVAVNRPVYGVFIVYDSNSAPVTGLTKGSFTIRLAYNATPSLVSVLLNEVANGRYVYTFTPTDVGDWYITITHPVYNPRGWDEEFTATAGGGGSGGGLPLEFYFTTEQVNESRRKFNAHLTEQIREDDELLVILSHMLD